VPSSSGALVWVATGGWCAREFFRTVGLDGGSVLACESWLGSTLEYGGTTRVSTGLGTNSRAASLGAINDVVDDQHMTSDCAPLRITPMHSGEAHEVANLLRAVVEPLSYYNELARGSEIAKYTAADLTEAVAEDPHSVAVARIGERLVGFSISKQDDGLIWLSWLGVDPVARRQGVARALLQGVEETARLRGAHKVWADSRTENVAMAQLFPQMGYQMITTISDHWYRQDFHLWQKPVQGACASPG
jgi:GNAT superfamily N-acetyltransferase